MAKMRPNGDRHIQLIEVFSADTCSIDRHIDFFTVIVNSLIVSYSYIALPEQIAVFCILISPRLRH